MMYVLNFINWFRNSRNTKNITSTISEAAKLVLPMKEIYELFHCDGFMWHDISVHTKLHKGQCRHSTAVRGHMHVRACTHKHKEQGDLISLYSFFSPQNNESRLKMITKIQKQTVAPDFRIKISSIKPT
jgi:hypothetical protein